MMLTQRALLLGAVALCFYLVAVVNSLQSFYYVLVWLAVGLLAASLGIALLSLTGTSCALCERRSSGYSRIGDQNNEAPPFWEAQLKNSGSLNKTGLVLEFRLKRENASSEQGRAGRAPVYARFLVEALPAGETMTAPLRLDFLPRGVYSLQSARLIGSDVLGLFRASKRLSLPEVQLKVVVAPPIVPLAARHEITRGVSDNAGTRATSRIGTGDDLRGVRTYVQGDDWRHVHWATTARTGELVVREFERTGRDNVLVVWDGVLGASNGREAATHIEEELCIVASLLAAIDAARTPVELVLLGKECARADANGQDGLISDEALSLLAQAKAERTRPLDESFVKERGFSQRSGQIFIVSSSLESDLVECVSNCVLRGENLIVALLEHSRVSGVHRFSRHGRAPSNSVESQQRALEQAGAHVVRVPIIENGKPLMALEEALVKLVEAI